MRELDQLLGEWLEQAWPSASATQQAAFDRLLDCEDDQIWDWLMGRREAPSSELAELIDLIGHHYQNQKQQARNTARDL
jgi:antitoxin CptB